MKDLKNKHQILREKKILTITVKLRKKPLKIWKSKFFRSEKCFWLAQSLIININNTIILTLQQASQYVRKFIILAKHEPYDSILEFISLELFFY